MRRRDMVDIIGNKKLIEVNKNLDILNRKFKNITRDCLDCLCFSDNETVILLDDIDQTNKERQIVYNEVFSMLTIICGISINSNIFNKECSIENIKKVKDNRRNYHVAFHDYPYFEVLKQNRHIKLRRISKKDRELLKNTKYNIRPDFILNNKYIQIKHIDLCDIKQVNDQINDFNRIVKECPAEDIKYYESFDYVFICTFGINSENKEKIINKINELNFDKIYMVDLNNFYYGSLSLLDMFNFGKHNENKEYETVKKLYMCCGYNCDKRLNSSDILSMYATVEIENECNIIDKSFCTTSKIDIRKYDISYEFEMLCKHYFSMENIFDFDKIKKSGKFVKFVKHNKIIYNVYVKNDTEIEFNECFFTEFEIDGCLYTIVRRNITKTEFDEYKKILYIPSNICK
jgi:hypothetical protein